MGQLTMTRMIAQLTQASGNRVLDPTTVIEWINSAQNEFAYAFQFPELQRVASIPTVAGTVNYTMPADFRAMGEDGVRIITPQNRFGGILTKETRTNYLRSDRFPQTSSQGIARAYHMYQKKMWLRPAPDATVTSIEFDYWAKPTPFASGTDISVFDDDWDDVIIRGAMYRMHLAYGEHDRMINVYNLFLGLIRSRVMAYDLEEFPEGGISMIQSQYDNLIR